MGRATQAEDATSTRQRAGSARTANLFGAVGLLWVGAHAFGALGPLTDLTFVLLAITALVTSAIGTRRNQPRVRWPWWAMSLSVLFFLVGGAVRQAVGSFGDLTEQRSLLPDLLVLPGYLLVAAANAGFVRARWHGRGRDIDAFLDSVIAALGAMAVAWAYLIMPALSNGDVPLKVRLSLAIFPPLSVFVTALAARVAFAAGRRMTTAQRSFMVAMLAMVLGDVLSTLGDAHLVAVPKALADAPYAFAFLALGFTVLHPSMRELTEPVNGTFTAAPTRGRLALIAIALGVPSLIALSRGSTGGPERGVLVGIVLALTAAMSWRIFRSLREQARSQAHLAHQATHDPLTGLPNRSYVLEHLDRMLETSHDSGAPFAVLFLDVDRFKLVNDTGGHSLGDEMLVAIAGRLQGKIRPGDVVARIGGDEFIIVIGQVTDLSDAMVAAERMLICFQSPFALRGNDVYTSASVGLVFADPGSSSQDAESLIRDADTAMYQAKAAGRDGVAVFDRSMRDRVAERVLLEHDLRTALDNGELHLHYQPILSLHDERVVGLEALLRWSHPTRGLVPPDLVIPIAEETGQIIDIGAWVIAEAARDVARWRRTTPGSRDLYVAVNVSARQLRDAELVNRVSTALSSHRLDPAALCLELTESVLMDDPAAATETLRELRGLGVRLSLDDFGTGYSSLSYLKRFPVNDVKIDRSFVEGLENPDSSEESLVAAIVAMANALGMTTVAEGVEVPLQAERLRHLGADKVQGYLYARPLPVDAVHSTLARLDSERYVGLPDIA
jgi:diguanylate cyclase (GGDEF)-like protein